MAVGDGQIVNGDLTGEVGGPLNVEYRVDVIAIQGGVQWIIQLQKTTDLIERRPATGNDQVMILLVEEHETFIVEYHVVATADADVVILAIVFGVIQGIGQLLRS